MNGKWIWAGDSPECENRRACFTDSIAVPAGTESCEIHITAVNKYVLYLNGERVGYGAARQEPGHCVVDTYEVMPLLKSGENHLAVQAWDYGWSTYQSVHDQGGLWYEVFADGILLTASGERTRAKNDEGYISFAPKRNVNLGFGDYYDARKFSRIWISEPSVSADWSGAKVMNTSRELHRRTIRSFQMIKKFPERILSLEEINAGGQVLSINTRDAFFPGRKDADEVTVNGVIGLVISAPHALDGRITFPGRLWNCMQGTFRIGGNVYPVTDQNRDIPLTIPAGESLMLVQLHGKFDDFYCHIEFRFPEKLTFKGYGTDRCCFVIGPTASLVSVTDGRGEIYDLMSPLTERDERIFSCAALEELEKCGEELRWIDARYVMADMNIEALNRMAKTVRNCSVRPEHYGVLWDNTECTRIGPPETGEKMRLLLDLGDLYVGNPEFVVKAESGTVIDIYGFENMVRGEIDYTLGLNNGLRYICTDGWQKYHCMARMGMRYVMITVSGNTKPVELQKFFLRHTTYACSNAGTFECNDYLLNRIWKICQRTHENCLEDSFTDCPTYEQTYWTGDAQTSAAVNVWVYGDYELLRHNLLLGKTAFRNSPIGNALTPTDWNTSIPMWSFNWFMSFCQYIENSGDRTIIPELYDAVKTMLEYYAGLMTPEGGLLISAWNFVDWAPIDYPARCVPTAYQIMLRWCFNRFAEIGEETGKTEDAAHFRALAEKARAFLNTFLWSEERQALYDSWCPETGYGKTFSIQTHIFAVRYGGIQSRDRVDLIRGYILQKPEDFIAAGSPFMLYYLYEAWAKLGRVDAIFEDIRIRWGEMLRYETTTCWEVFPGFYENSRTRSYCHSWSTSPAALMQELLLGVHREQDGFRAVTLRLPETSLRWCRGTVPTPQGMILVDWSKDLQEVRIRVPEEIRLTVEYPEEFKIRMEYTE